MLRPHKKKYLAGLLLLTAVALSGCITTKELGIMQPPQLSARQREAMQTKELPGDFNTAFAATISVLQDEGWQLDTVDKPSGIIQASSLRFQDIIGPYEDYHASHDPEYRKKLQKRAKKSVKKNKGPGLLEWTRWEQLSVHIEPWGTNTVRERITITKYGTVPSNTYSVKGKQDQQLVGTIGGKEQSIIIDNPTRYQYLFQQIRRAIFVRQGLTKQK